MALSRTAASPTREDSSEKEAEMREQRFPASPSETSKEDLEETPADGISNEGGTWVTGLALFTILGAICLVCFLMLLDTSIIVTAIPQITTDFHSLQDVGWYGSAYQLSRCVPCLESDCGLTKVGESAALLPLTGNLYVNFDSKVSRSISIVEALYLQYWLILPSGLSYVFSASSNWAPCFAALLRPRIC